MAMARSRWSSRPPRPCRRATAAPRSSSSTLTAAATSPPAGTLPAWPRYNNLPGPGNDADRNGPGHSGFGCYGLNVGIGDVDDDPAEEIIVTYDNHFIQAFDHDGVAIDSSNYFTNRTPPWVGNRLTWGQFIRWADPQVEHDHYHLHTGQWPHPDWTEWLQWTASPPSVADLDGDGRHEVVAVPNVERYVPYVTQAYAIMVLEGSHGDGARSARRKAGWETLPRGDAPIVVEGWYPPYGIPSPTIVNTIGDSRPEIVVSLNDGWVYCFTSTGQRLWRTDYRHGHPIDRVAMSVIGPPQPLAGVLVKQYTQSLRNRQSRGVSRRLC